MILEGSDHEVLLFDPISFTGYPTIIAETAKIRLSPDNTTFWKELLKGVDSEDILVVQPPQGDFFNVLIPHGAYVASSNNTEVMTVLNDQRLFQWYPVTSSAIDSKVTGASVPAIATNGKGGEGSANPSQTGGIDLNAKNMNLDLLGQNPNLQFNPAMIAQFKRGDFSGIEPDIISIIPIKSVLSLTGIK